MVWWHVTLRNNCNHNYWHHQVGFPSREIIRCLSSLYDRRNIISVILIVILDIIIISNLESSAFLSFQLSSLASKFLRLISTKGKKKWPFKVTNHFRGKTLTFPKVKLQIWIINAVRTAMSWIEPKFGPSIYIPFSISTTSIKKTKGSIQTADSV